MFRGQMNGTARPLVLAEQWTPGPYSLALCKELFKDVYRNGLFLGGSQHVWDSSLAGSGYLQTRGAGRLWQGLRSPS